MSSMVMTVLEAHVAPEKGAALEGAFNQAIKELEPGIVQTFLLHGSADPTLWRIATLWRSRQALSEMRASGVTPRGVLIFREAGAEAEGRRAQIEAALEEAINRQKIAADGIVMDSSSWVISAINPA